MKNLGDEILLKYLSGECSDEELAEVSAWMKESEDNAGKLFRMEEIYQAGKSQRYGDMQRTATAERRLFRRIEREQAEKDEAGARKARRVRRWAKYVATAAAVVLVAVVGFKIYEHGTAPEMLIAKADEGIVKEILLPDGSKVWLNNSSTLHYPKEFSHEERTVRLDGEAYFEVTKDSLKPFIVKSDAMRVKVLGTKFNFKCDKYDRIAEASLIEGEIEVKGNNNEGQIVLMPGQRAELYRSRGRLVVKQGDTKLDAVWHDDIIPFDRANIFVISKALERFYNVDIILSPDIQSDKTYSGAIKRRETVESVLTSLQNSIPFEYRIDGNAIFLTAAKK